MVGDKDWSFMYHIRDRLQDVWNSCTPVNIDDETLRTTMGSETGKTKHIFPDKKQILGQYLYIRMVGIYKLMYAQ